MNKFGEKSGEMVGNKVYEEKNKTYGQGFLSSAFVCQACGFKRQDVGHRVRANQCSRELQKKYFNNGGK
jgi:hypothetical protein